MVEVPGRGELKVGKFVWPVSNSSAHGHDFLRLESTSWQCQGSEGEVGTGQERERWILALDFSIFIFSRHFGTYTRSESSSFTDKPRGLFTYLLGAYKSHQLDTE